MLNFFILASSFFNDLNGYLSFKNPFACGNENNYFLFIPLIPNSFFGNAQNSL